MAKKLYYKIGEACKTLEIQPYVLRYWETEFSALRPSKSKSGQRVYSEKDLQIIGRVKELLYDEGYTIAGAKKKLEAELVSGDVKPTRKPAAAPAEKAEKPVKKAAKKPAKKPTAKKATAKKTAAKTAKKKAKTTSKKASGVDTEAAKQIAVLRKGVEKALKETRAILELLD